MKATWVLALIVAISLSTTNGQDLAKQTCSANQNEMNVNFASANVVFGGTMSVRNGKVGTVGCGQVSGSSMQWVEAVRFTINYLNNLNSGQGFLPGITFGMNLYDSCGSSINALRDVQRLYPQTTTYSPYCANQTPAKVNLGLLGPFYSSIALPVAEYAKHIPLTVLSPLAASELLSDSTKYPTFFRTVPSTAAQGMAIGSLLKTLGWKKTVVIHTDDSYGMSCFRQTIVASQDYDICVSNAVSLPYLGTIEDYKRILATISANDLGVGVIAAADEQARLIMQAIYETPALHSVHWVLYDIDVNNPATAQNMRQLKGAMAVMPRASMISLFRDYFVGLEMNPANVNGNPWFKEWYEIEYGCSLTPGAANRCQLKDRTTLNRDFRQSPYVLTIIKAVYAYAMAFRSLCPTSNGVCAAAAQATPEQIQNALRNMNGQLDSNVFGLDNQIEFDSNGDSLNSAFSVHQYKSVNGVFGFTEIGEYTNGQTTVTPIYYDANRQREVTKPSSDCGSAGCSSCLLPPQKINFHYTAGDVVIGSLINGHLMSGNSLFDCGADLEKRFASLVAAKWAIDNFKSKFNNELRGISLGSLVADVCPSGPVAAGFLNKVLSSSSDLTDGSGLVIAAQRNIYGFVDDTDGMMAEYISPMLSQYKIPEIQAGDVTKMMDSLYVSQIVPSEEVYVNALTSLLLAKNWKHVQVVTEMNTPYEHMAMRFKAYAAKMGICVVSTRDLHDGTATVVNQLFSEPSAFVVVTFGHASNIKQLFNQIKASGNGDDLQMVSGMAEWGTDPRYFDNIGTSQPAEYAITMGLRRRANNDFQSYLQGLSRSSIVANSFLTSLFEVTNKCSLVASSRGTYDRVCTQTDRFTPYQGNSPYVIQAVFNMAHALHEIITEECGQNYNGLCVQFQRKNDISERMARKLRNSVDIANGKSSSDIVYYVVSNGLYQEFGVYDTDTMQVNTVQGINSNNLNQKFNSRATTCPGSCMECQYLYTYKDIVYRPGNVIIAGSFQVSNPGPMGLQPYICGDVKTTDGPLMAAAMLYALDQVNNKQAPVSVKGLTFGGLMLDHCNNEGRQKLMLSDIYSGFLHPHMKVDSTDILSWITSGSPSTKEASTLLDPLAIPMISPDAQAEHLKDSEYFFSTIQGDAALANAFVKMARQLAFRYVQVVYASSASDSKDTLVSVAHSEGICVTQSVEYSESMQPTEIVNSLMRKETKVVVLLVSPSQAEQIMEAISLNNNARNSLVLMLPEPFKSSVDRYAPRMAYPPLAVRIEPSTLTDFKAYLNSNPIGNVFFARYYMKLFQCNLEGYYVYSTNCNLPLAPVSSSRQFQDSVFDLATINAVYASVDALDRTIKQYCGTDYTMPCPEYLHAPDQRKQFVKNLQSVSFVDEGKNAFRFLQKEGNIVFDVMQFSQTRNVQIKVGSYAGVSLHLDTAFINSYKDVESACNLPCLECLNRGLNFSITPGDIYLGGMFDVHESSYNPFICGRIKTLHGFLLLEAFHYALEQVNSDDGQFKGILNGVKLGGIGLDACTSQVRGGQLVSNINNNLTPLTKDAITVEASEIDAYIGSYDSGSSRYLARILTDLEIPQISYAAVSTDLSDQRRYPFFYRTVPSNVHQARAILTYLNDNNIRYIQILYVGNNYGESGKEELEKLAKEYKICVAQTVEYEDLAIASPQRAKAVLSKLLEKPSANTVVTFLGTNYINSVLRAVSSSDRARNKLRFVGSDVWADNKNAIDGAEVYAVDSVTLKLDADDISSFENYINSMTLANSADNPWFEEYYQNIHNCYTTPGNPYGYANPCPQTRSSIIRSRRYQQDPNVITVINSVYASAFAIDKTLTQLCGVGYRSVCQAYRNSMDRRKAIDRHLADVEFTDPSGSHFKFTDREVKLNYRLNAVVSGDLQGVIYQQIGTYNTSTETLSMDQTYKPSRPWNSDCDREDACSECPSIRDSSVRYTFYPKSLLPEANDPIVVGFFDIHKQGVDPYRCGEINPHGFQQFLAFLSTVDRYNSGSLPQRNAQQGYFRVLAIDTCSNPVRLDQDLFGLLQGTGICNSDFVTPDGASFSASNIAAVVTSGDMNTMAASRLLEQLGISYVSPNAKSPLLDNKNNLYRSVTPISGEMKFLTSLSMEMGWSYMDVMYEETAVGYYRWHSLQQYAANQGICLGSEISVPVDTENQDLARYLNLLNGNRGSNVVVLMGSKDFFKRMLQTAAEDSTAQDYVWILSSDSEINEDYIEEISPAGKKLHIISFYSQSYVDSQFNQRLQQFRNGQNVNNMLPAEWMEDLKEMFDKHGNNMMMKQDKYVVNTIAGTYAASASLAYLNRRNRPFITKDDRESIRQAIAAERASLSTENGASVAFKFNSDRWWDQGFVFNYWMVDDKDAQMAQLDESDLASSLEASLNISSMCMESMKNGFCGCDIGTAFSAKVVDAPDYIPASHRNYYEYKNSGDRRYDWPVWAIVLAVLTSVGLFVAVVLFLILICAYPKKGGTSILGYMMIFGIIGIYAINFTFFLSATDAVCGARRFLMGVVYAVCFAPLLIKAVDNWRFGHIDYDERRYTGISSACCLLLSAIGIVLIQCIIPIMWLILEHPSYATYPFSGSHLHDNDWCGPPDDYDLGLVLSFCFVVFLVFVTAIFAALSYQTTSNNYESRWIFLASVATAGCFLVWMIVTTNAKGVYRDPAVAIANFCNATILLIVIPIRKMSLMIRAKNHKDEESEENDKNPYDMYSESYVNPGYELSDYDQVYIEKPSEF